MESLLEAGEHLNLAIMRNDKAGLIRLLEEGYDVNAVGRLTRRTPLHHAAFYGKEDLVDVLLQHKADVNINTSDRQGTPLHMCCASGNLEIVKKLTAVPGCDVNAVMEYNHTPLMVAISKRRTDVIEHLVTVKGCDLELSSYISRTALMMAAEEGYLEAVKALAAAGCELNHQDERGRTALHFCVLVRHNDVIRALIQYNVDINHPDNKGNTPLHRATTKDYLEVIGILVEHGANLYACNSMRDVPLNTAVREGYPKVAQKLFEVGTNGNLLENSPLMTFFIGDCPSLENCLEMLEILIQGGVDVNAKRKHFGIESKYTGFEFALVLGYLDLALIILDTGVDLKNVWPFVSAWYVDTEYVIGSDVFFEEFKMRLFNPKTLKSLTRLLIKNRIGNMLHASRPVDKLPIPSVLKNFILMTDLFS